MNEVEENTKKYVNSKFKTFVEKLDHSLSEQIVNPMTEAIDTVKELKKQVSDLEKKMDEMQSILITRSFGESNEDFSFNKIDASVNSITITIEMIYTFFKLMEGMIMGKKEYSEKEIAERILNDFGEIGGMTLSVAMQNYLKESKGKKMKETWEKVMKLLKESE